MNFSNMDEAKRYVVEVARKSRTLEDIDSSVDWYQKLIDRSVHESSKDLWQAELHKLVTWKNGDEFKSGKYPQGINELLFELIEWRSAIFSFQKVDTKVDLFKESGFFAQWYVGAIYGIFTIIGKLVSKHSSDSSLRKLWENVSPVALKNQAFTETELDYINAEMHPKSGRFTNANSQVILFRNKLIAHNEVRPAVKWAEVDNEIGFLIRMWSLLITWSSFGVNHPFRTDDQAFFGLELIFEPSELEALKSERRAYLERVKTWSKCFAHTGEVDPGRDAFSPISLQIST